MTSALQKQPKKGLPISGTVSSVTGTKPIRKPHGYQQRGVEWLLSHGGAGLFADPGTGKTAIVLRALLALKDAKVGKRTLIVAPLRVASEVWPTEPVEWEGSEWDRIRTLKIVLLHGKGKEEARQEKADVYVINFDGLKWLFADNYREFKKLQIDTLVIDESSKMKKTRTKRFKMFKPMLPTFKRRWILTGSPNPNGYMDVFGQIYVIDLGKALGPYITHFRMEYFIPLDRFGWTWVLKKGAEKEIQKKLAPYIFRLDAEDYLKMPKVMENVVRVELPPEARKVYDEMEAEMITRLESGNKVVVAKGAGASSVKCAQIANGGLYHMPFSSEDYEDWRTGQAAELPPPTKRTWTNLHTAKIEAVEEIVDELNGSPCLVVYDFEHDLDRLTKAFGKDVPRIGGGVSVARSRVILADWNADKIPMLFVHPKAMSHGLNMQYGTAQHIIWHSLTYDYEDYDQLIRRLRRQGSRHDVIFVHQIVAKDTVDEPKLAALRKKGKTQSGFLDALKAYAQRRKIEN